MVGNRKDNNDQLNWIEIGLIKIVVIIFIDQKMVRKNIE